MMATKVWDVLVVPYYGDALDDGSKFRRSGGKRILPGDVVVVSAAAGPAVVDGMRVGAIFVDDSNFTSKNPNRAKWAWEVIDALIGGQR